MTDQPNVEVITTMRLGAQTKTFTATATTEGEPGNTARALLFAVRDDAVKWTYDMERTR
ncbi:hypothetical protein [Actinoplanes sp. URMC 104]|uniref:hypothetical protein n=1 Tax=Actinoplanes sp. URMC 104 TaxID=3423409 RepID=UPI003F1965B7